LDSNWRADATYLALCKACGVFVALGGQRGNGARDLVKEVVDLVLVKAFAVLGL
jgi:hypothetical protein